MNKQHPVLVQPLPLWKRTNKEHHNYPNGLYKLSHLDEIHLNQKTEVLEAINDIEVVNKYVIKDDKGTQLYSGYEDSGICMKLCCGAGRGFMMHVLDEENEEVIRMTKPFKCCSGMCWCANANNCCSETINIESPPGVVIGSVRQSKSFWRPYYEVFDLNGLSLFKIKGPCCICSGFCCCSACCAGYPFEILSPEDNVPAGSITKIWQPGIKEMFSDSSNLSLSFPIGLGLEQKATLLGAAILIDILWFEDING